MENVGRKSESDRKIESRDTERESSHPHSVRGSRYQALCCHLSAANARHSVRRTGHTDKPPHTQGSACQPMVQSLSASPRTGVFSQGSSRDGRIKIRRWKMAVTKACVLCNLAEERGREDHVLTKRKTVLRYFGAQNAADAIIALLCEEVRLVDFRFKMKVYRIVCSTIVEVL